MSDRLPRSGFVSHPAPAENWIRAADAPAARSRSADAFTARLTIDVTPELRGRIKVAAFRSGVTVADMLRDLLTREFPSADGDAS